MEDAGVEVAKSKLFTRACECLAVHGGNPFRALASFRQHIKTDDELAREIALEYLVARADDMKSAPGGGGQSSSEFQKKNAPESFAGNGNGDHLKIDTQLSRVADDSTKAGSGHRECETQCAPAAPPSSKPSVTSEARRAAVVARLSVFDSYKIRGRAVGDLQRHELKKIIAQNTRESAVLKIIDEKCGAHTDDFAKVRDLINEATLQRAIQRAAEMQDAN